MLRLLLLFTTTLLAIQGCAESKNAPYLPPIVSSSSEGISPEQAAIGNSEFIDQQAASGN